MALSSLSTIPANGGGGEDSVYSCGKLTACNAQVAILEDWPFWKKQLVLQNDFVSFKKEVLNVQHR